MEPISHSGITAVMFNSKSTPESEVTTEPMMTLVFTLDPSLMFVTDMCSKLSP